MDEWMTSTGLDIGTSTTKFIVSKLRLGKVSNHFALPQYKIVERKIMYESPMFSTPLLDKEQIDVSRLSAWLTEQYAAAELDFSKIKSGAVIITGETAIKSNAEKMLHYLAERSGDFVVAIAGASLESVLAGKGSGAYMHSKETNRTIANIDIGGGTANTVIFKKGKVLAAITFRVGGRLIELQPNGTISYISPSLLPWLTEKGFHVRNNQTVTFHQLNELVSELAKDMLDILQNKARTNAHLTLIHSGTTDHIPDFDDVIISGGVGKLLAEEPPKTIEEIARYHDIGPLIAAKVFELFHQSPFGLVGAKQTARATVIGAGMQSTEVSGATIHIHSAQLPLKNIPVVTIHFPANDYVKETIKRDLGKGKAQFIGDEKVPFAISIKGLPYCSYQSVKEIASGIKTFYETEFPQAEVIAVVCENDMAKSLGQTLKLQTKSKYAIVCIDQIHVEHGDYIDIGEMINDTMVPVVIKTLVFS